MTGFDSKRQAAKAKLNDDDDTQVYADTLLIVYQRGFADGKAAANAMHELARLGQEIEQEPCVGKDLQCPCQDGDACHYKDCGSTKALPVPVAQPEQEPVAKLFGTLPVFDTPPAAQRTWVGLDEDDIRKLYGKDLNYRDGNYVRYAMAVEAKLKEKNGH
jgi:hypothetical protein